jgi:hypothetical protein
MDAIFIQSCKNEFANPSKGTSRAVAFLKSISLVLPLNIPVYLFLDAFDNKNLDLKRLKQDFPFLSEIVCVDDRVAKNPTSCVFFFMMTYMTDLYKKILVLETDCLLEPNFDFFVKNEISKIPNDDWFILGSKYRGIGHFRATTKEEFGAYKERLNFNKLHMNGVAVYNRNQEFNSFILEVANADEVYMDVKMNYDFYIFLYLYEKNLYESKCLESKSILNISSRHDSDLDWKSIDPNAKIIHTKLAVSVEAS